MTRENSETLPDNRPTSLNLVKFSDGRRFPQRFLRPSLLVYVEDFPLDDPFFVFPIACRRCLPRVPSSRAIGLQYPFVRSGCVTARLREP
jgi:hypothetical protein